MKIKPNFKIREIAGEKMVVMQSKDGVDLTIGKLQTQDQRMKLVS